MSRLAQLVKNKIAKEIGYGKWYSKFLTLADSNSSDECRFSCPFHSDSNPSASLNITTGLWQCKSAACGAAGDPIEFYYLLNNLKSRSQAIYNLAIDLGVIAEITDETVDQLNADLFQSDDLVQRAVQMFEVSAETLQKHKIGIHVSKKKEVRFTIPVRGSSGYWEDIRRYNRTYDAKMLHWAEGHGAARVFPIEALRNHDLIYLFEGERDCLRAHDLGFTNAITITAGAGQLPDDYQELFDGKTIVLCYDIDAAGQKGAQRVAKRLATCARAISLVHLPEEGLPSNGDFSDWCDLGNRVEEFLTLTAAAEPVDIRAVQQIWQEGPTRGESSGDLDEEDAPVIDFADLMRYTNHTGDLRFLARTMGITAGMKPYAAPRQIGIECPHNQKKLCPHCKIDKLGEGPHVYTIDLRNEPSLQYFRCNVETKENALKKACGIPPQCPVVKIKDYDRQAVQELILAPPADLQTMRQEYGNFRQGFYQGDPIQDNRDYWFTGRVQADPKSQAAVINIHRAEPSRTAIEEFRIDQQVHEAIGWFRPESADLARHFGRLIEGISRHVGIYGRSEVALAVLESIYSAARFSIGKKEVFPGVIENLVIGDSRTGKSKMATGIMRIANIGEYITCENVTLAGLIGGLEQIGDVRVPIWGAWPRNHNGFMTLDEINELTRPGRSQYDVIGSLGSVRTYAVAEITKVVQARMQALVRTVWITNPANGKPIRTYGGAIRAIPGVILSPPDIARFTKAYAVSEETVSIDQITGVVTQPLSEEVCRHYHILALLTWSLRPEQIRFTEDAQTYLRAQAERLVEKYDAGIPLIDRGSCLDKIARLSVPVAVLCGNFVQSGETLELEIDRAHAYYAVNSLEYTYDDPTMGYYAYSNLERGLNQIIDPASIHKMFQSEMHGIPPAAIAKYFLSQTNPTPNAFKEFCGLPTTAQNVWAALVRNNCLRIDGSSYTKTAEFVQLLNDYLT